MESTATAINAQQLGKDLMALAAKIRSWAPVHADRMDTLIEQARQAMPNSQYRVISFLMLACDEARSAALSTSVAIERRDGLEIIDRLNREISQSCGLHAFSPDNPEF